MSMSETRELDLDALEKRARALTRGETLALWVPEALALIERARNADALRFELDQMDGVHERAQLAELSNRDLQAKVSTLRAHLAKAVEALEPFARRADYLNKADDDSMTHWHPAIGNPLSAADLRRARSALSQLNEALK